MIGLGGRCKPSDYTTWLKCTTAPNPALRPRNLSIPDMERATSAARFSQSDVTQVIHKCMRPFTHQNSQDGDPLQCFAYLFCKFNCHEWTQRSMLPGKSAKTWLNPYSKLPPPKKHAAVGWILRSLSLSLSPSVGTCWIK